MDSPRAADIIHNFDAGNDVFAFSGIGVAGGHIEHVESAALSAVTKVRPRLRSFGQAMTTSRSISM